MIVNSGQVLFENRPNAVYDLFEHIGSGLFIDIGAAAGYFTRIMLEKSPKSNVYAFEPFAGNHGFFEREIGPDNRVRLIKKAASDRQGFASFHVASTVQGSEPGWEGMAGYSSAGRVVSGAVPSKGMNLSVQTCRVDDEVAENVRLCKIDVQGHEYAALRGMEETIVKYGVDVIVVEFSGDVDTIEFLIRHNYRIYDHRYILICSKGDPMLSEWTELETVKLSTGRRAYHAWPTNAPRSAADYCNWMQQQTSKIGGVFTDLVCVHRTALPSFLSAAAAALEGQRQ